jgi:hypothetical protein
MSLSTGYRYGRSVQGHIIERHERLMQITPFPVKVKAKPDAET